MADTGRQPDNFNTVLITSSLSSEGLEFNLGTGVFITTLLIALFSKRRWPNVGKIVTNSV